MEIRRIQPHEARTYLSLLCRVFSLDLDRAEPVFFAEPYYSFSSKWALFDEGRMASILSVTPLEFGWGKAHGIAGVATDSDFRGRGLATVLLEHVLDHCAKEDMAPSLLFAHQPKLYERVGYQEIDVVLKGMLRTTDERSIHRLEMPEITDIYAKWASADENRLRRDETRWSCWSWMSKECAPVAGGYVCCEPLYCREVIWSEPMKEWPGAEGLAWCGLRSMTDRLGVPVMSPEVDMHLMARGFSSQPQMFMTDQF